MNVLSPQHCKRPWGFFDEFVRNTSCTVKMITVNPGEALSLQHHKNRSEFWVIVKGTGFVTVGDVRTEAHEGDRYSIDAGIHHRAEGGDAPLVFLEISTGDFDDDDIVRVDDKYGRIQT